MMVRYCCCFAGYLICTASVAAGVPAIIPSGGSTVRDRDWVVGYEFSVTKPVRVNALGKWDANDNGVLDDLVAPQVGLWDATTQELLRQVVIAVDTPSTDQAFYADIEPIDLTRGNYVVAAQMFDDREPFFYPNAVDMIAGMEWEVGIRESVNDTLVFPTRRTSVNSHFGPVFRVDHPVLVQSPGSWSIHQQQDRRSNSFPVHGVVSEAFDTVEGRVVGADGEAGSWVPLDISGDEFTGAIPVPEPGWYAIEVRGTGDAGSFVDRTEQVGLGEVFVIAGQSNSANHGRPPQTSATGMVGAMDERGKWGPANDPLPIATGLGGSPWPLLGDQLAESLGMPIGFVSVGWGGTRVDEWLPGGSLYPRLQDALSRLGPFGARAVLWHQGESDALASTSTADYRERLEAVIRQSREDAGYEIPWGVARAAYLPVTTLAQEAAVVAAQEEVIANDPLAFAGAATDDLLGPDLRYDAIHFGQAGLEEHARRWFDAIWASQLVPEPASAHWCLLLFCLFRPRPTSSTETT